MIRHSRFTLLISVVVATLVPAGFASAQSYSVWDTHDVQIESAADTVTIRTTGNDPYVVWQLPQPAGEGDRMLELEYFAPQEIDSFYAFLGPPISEVTRVELRELTIAEGWQTYTARLRPAPDQTLPTNVRYLRLDFGMQPGVRLQIRNLQLREPNAREQQQEQQREQLRQQKTVQAEQIREYLAAAFPVQWDQVAVQQDSIRLSGSLPQADQPLVLWEYPASTGITESPLQIAKVDLAEGRFEIELPRMVEGRDRVGSGWRVSRPAGDDRPPQFVSPRRYADTFAVHPGPVASHRAEPGSQKGLGGISFNGPLHELPELGITAITINLNVASFLTRRDNGTPRIDDGSGPAVYFQSQAFARYDKLIDFARRHDIVVSAIVLIPRSKNPDVRTALAHPESDGGVYAMPDLTTPRATQLYAEVIKRIARRYRDPQRAPGGIANWILHNEVDFHPVWTNMGPQPRHVVMETYYRSMRLVHNIARTYNPHARVFASLTHHWHVPEPSWRQLSPREMIEVLQRYSKLEGDFAWGVAYHPYPQSLFAEVAWQDTKIEDGFETPLITIQNLEVLGQFLQQAGMRDPKGRMRPVLLSEQGFHSASYRAEDQANQAGSLAYAMRKIRELPWIESFHYHRWIDHPDEGGLMLGLKTLPSDEHPYGRKKKAWQVYQAIGTEREDEVTRGLPRP